MSLFTHQFIDSVSVMAEHPPISPESKAAMSRVWDRFRAHFAKHGDCLFFVEAPRNHLPYPPTGWFALRSTTRRLFMQLDHGSYPRPEEIQRRLEAGEFTEVPLEPEAQELWDADPTCQHEVVEAPGGGVKCTKCAGWMCL